MSWDRIFHPDTTAQGRARGFASGTYRGDINPGQLCWRMGPSPSGDQALPAGCCLAPVFLPCLHPFFHGDSSCWHPLPSNIQSRATPAAMFASIPVPQLLLVFHTALGALPGESLGSPSCSPERHSLVDQQVLVGVLWLCSAVPRAFPHGCVAVAALTVAFPWGHRGKRRAAPWEGRVEEEVPRESQAWLGWEQVMAWLLGELWWSPSSVLELHGLNPEPGAQGTWSH